MFVTVWAIAANGQTTNVVLLEHVADSLIATVLEANAEVLNGAVCITNAGPRHDADWLFEQRIIAGLQHNAVMAVYVHNDPDGCDTMNSDSLDLHVFEYHIGKLQILYEPSKPVSDIANPVRRTVMLMMNFRILGEPEGRVLWSGTLEKHLVDTVDQETIPSLEDEHMRFTQGSYVQADKEAGILQPILVATVTGVVVYLFYAFRSR